MPYTNLPAMTLRWTTAPAPRFTGLTGASPGGHGDHVETHTGDIDGDGYADLVRVGFGDEARVAYFRGGPNGLPDAAAGSLTQGAISFPVGSGEESVLSFWGWSSLLADVDADGLDDLVVWSADAGRAFMLIAKGTAGRGLGAFERYAFARELFEFARRVGAFAMRSLKTKHRSIPCAWPPSGSR